MAGNASTDESNSHAEHASHGEIATSGEIGLTYQGRPRTHGFRLSLVDAFVVLLAAVVTLATIDATGGFSWLLLFVVLHFFLFCNVFRVRRAPELVWAFTFLANCGVWIATGHVDLLGIVGSQCLITLGILINEMRSPNYHGIFARRINSRLDDYLAGRADVVERNSLSKS
ncbi:hypothetical protein FHS27_004051 [Rhodopirellula rubra]|uniref:Uncharacterized protein n=1 Tax=Aporhodopirellula rubra TaxID=980271 RepID=A0A7W5H795_9BACT|nr:hypothetical protein [Aporhodopirellula rubra]MBB3208224.1 hypothetical protein [Aporhodopirellula rubra]